MNDVTDPQALDTDVVDDPNAVVDPNAAPVDDGTPTDEPTMSDAIAEALKEDAPAGDDDDLALNGATGAEGGDQPVPPKSDDKPAADTPAAPDGDAAKKDGEPDLVPLDKTPEQIKAEQEAADAKKEDDAALEEPEGLSEKASARFKKLAGMVKDRDTAAKDMETRIGQVQHSAQVLSNVIASFSADPQTPIQPKEMDRLARFSRNLRTGTVESLQYCLKEAEMYYNQIAGMLGQKTPSFNPLDAAPELKAKVERMEMTEEEALSHIHNQQTGQINQSHQQEQQAQQAFTNEMNTLSNVVSNMEMQWANDARYDQPAFAHPTTGQPTSVKQIMTETAMAGIRAIQDRKMTGQQLLQTLTQRHQNLMGQLQQSAPPAAPAGQPPGTPASPAHAATTNQQPLNQRSHAQPLDQRKTAPSSMFDAINQSVNG